MSIGAHDLILHILEPSLEQRATLLDIATHPWLQDRSRQDSGSLYVISTPDSSDDGSVKHTGDSVDKGSPVSDDHRMYFYSDYHGTVARVSVASSFDDSLSLWENDDQSLSVSRRRDPPPDVEGYSCCMQDSFTSGDYIPLHDNSAINNYRQLSRDITPGEEFHITADGCTFSDQFITSPHAASNFHFRPSSGNAHCNHEPLSDASQVITQDGSSLAASGALAATTETAKLPKSFSADSLELFVDGGRDNRSCDDSNGDEYHDCDIISVKHPSDDDDSHGDVDDDSGGDRSRCDIYDFADIDAVLDHIASDVVVGTDADVDEGSQVSHDSLEDAV